MFVRPLGAMVAKGRQPLWQAVAGVFLMWYKE